MEQSKTVTAYWQKSISQLKCGGRRARRGRGCTVCFNSSYCPVRWGRRPIAYQYKGTGNLRLPRSSFTLLQMPSKTIEHWPLQFHHRFLKITGILQYKYAFRFRWPHPSLSWLEFKHAVRGRRLSGCSHVTSCNSHAPLSLPSSPRLKRKQNYSVPTPPPFLSLQTVFREPLHRCRRRGQRGGGGGSGGCGGSR